MADIERELLVSLGTASREEQAKAVARGLLPDHFRSCEKEALWCWEYLGKYGKFPPVRMLKLTFPEFISVPTPEPVSFYLDRMFERVTYEGLSRILGSVQKKLKDRGLSAVKEAAQEAMAVQDLLKHGYSSDLAWGAWNAAEHYRLKESGGVVLRTPYPSLNRMIRGVRRKQLFSIVARPGMTKTWVALLFGLCFWEQDEDVLIVSKEMGAEELYERSDALYFQLNWNKYQSGKYTQKEMEAIQRQRVAMFAQRKNKFIVTDSEDGDNGLPEVEAKITEHHPGVVIIDGAYLLDEAEGRDTWEKMRNLSKKTKRLARRYGVAVVQTLQFNRGAVNSEDGGDLDNIAYSDAFSLDSDFVLAIKGNKADAHRRQELLKGRNLLTAAGSYYTRAEFDPQVQLGELGGISEQCVEVDTVMG